MVRDLSHDFRSRANPLIFLLHDPRLLFWIRNVLFRIEPHHVSCSGLGTKGVSAAALHWVVQHLGVSNMDEVPFKAVDLNGVLMLIFKLLLPRCLVASLPRCLYFLHTIVEM